VGHLVVGNIILKLILDKQGAKNWIET